MKAQTKVALIWAQYGPYHAARAAALGRLVGEENLFAIEIASSTRDYAWKRPESARRVLTLFPGGITEEVPFLKTFRAARRLLAEIGVNVCFLPGYAPRQSLAVLLAAKTLGLRTIMMNESHAGTARLVGTAALAKRGLVKLFDAALVGGKPHRRYFVSLGIPDDRVFTGYDAVDNDFFARNAERVRRNGAALRSLYHLPAHYFLSLGRFVAKKNLSRLIRAFRLFLEKSQTKETHLVLVGSGEQEQELKALCCENSLPVYDKTAFSGNADQIHTETRSIQTLSPGVHFFGFRQIDENPMFYALADGFVLPSLKEEWGLVVNEAMASGLPVAVSETAGCAEDLLEFVDAGEVASNGGSLVHNLRVQHRLRKNGFVFDPNSCDELSRVLLCLECSAEMRSAMGLASRRIVEKYSCSNFAGSAVKAVNVALAGNLRHPREQELDPPDVALCSQRPFRK